MPPGVSACKYAVSASAAKLLWLASAEYWIYPLQTVLCGAVLVWFRREYRLRAPSQILFTVAIALLTITCGFYLSGYLTLRFLHLDGGLLRWHSEKRSTTR